MPVNSFVNSMTAFAATGTFAFWCLPGVAAAQVHTAVEYGLKVDRGSYFYYDQYFVTASPEEIAALDAGAFNGIWKRTGLTFNVWTGPENGAVPTCRFFQPFFIDHVYTPYAAECAAVQAHADWNYEYEGIAFYLKLPDEDGQCRAGTIILYRLYYEGSPRAHHELTDDPYDSDPGYVFEGNAPTSAFACAPSRTPPSTP
jgi:hypothetical protein